MLENSATAVVSGGELILLAAEMGVIAGNLWILPSKQSTETTNLDKTRKRLWQLFVVCLTIFTLAGTWELLLRTASMSDLPWKEAISQVGIVLFKTHYGHLWLWRNAALSVLWIVWVLNRPSSSKLKHYTGFTALFVIVVTLSTTGHAGDDGLLTLPNVANTLHILGGLLWGGGIIAAAAYIFPLLRHDKVSQKFLIAETALRLSTLAAIALVMVLLPGIYNSWLQIDSWHGLWNTLYGQLLVAKVSLVMVMIVMGALNRYRYVPALQRHAGLSEPRTLLPLPGFLRNTNDSEALSAFLRSLRAEAILLLGVLILAATLSQQTPAAHMDHEHMMDHAQS